jgi:hypothetical protein
MYIDRNDAPGTSAEQLAAAHLLDLGVQEKHGVKYHLLVRSGERVSFLSR